MSRTFDGPRNAKLATFAPDTPLKRVGKAGQGLFVGVSRFDPNLLVRARIVGGVDGWTTTIEHALEVDDALGFMLAFPAHLTEHNN
jgi:hypothetical protein